MFYIIKKVEVRHKAIRAIYSNTDVKITDDKKWRKKKKLQEAGFFC